MKAIQKDHFWYIISDSPPMLPQSWQLIARKGGWFQFLLILLCVSNEPWFWGRQLKQHGIESIHHCRFIASCVRNTLWGRLLVDGALPCSKPLCCPSHARPSLATTCTLLLGAEIGFQSRLEHKTCDILAAERLRLMRFDNRLIIVFPRSHMYNQMVIFHK